MTPELINPDELVERYRGHTPGPWAVVDVCNVWTESVATAPDGKGYPVAECVPMRDWAIRRGLPPQLLDLDIREANARLIADAPALLARVVADAATIERLRTALTDLKCDLLSMGFEMPAGYVSKLYGDTPQLVLTKIDAALSPNPDGGR